MWEWLGRATVENGKSILGSVENDVNHPQEHSQRRWLLGVTVGILIVIFCAVSRSMFLCGKRVTQLPIVEGQKL